MREVNLFLSFGCFDGLVGFFFCGISKELVFRVLRFGEFVYVSYLYEMMGVEVGLRIGDVFEEKLCCIFVEMIICIFLRFFINMIINFICILNIFFDYEVKNSVGRVWIMIK